jgi:voltage-gated potassium channel
MARFINQGEYIVTSLRASIDKIIVFLYTIMLLVCIFGAIMYLVEGPTNPAFDSIPRSIYWSIVTLTTVGFGDITPQTSFGQFLSAIIMILGYGVIAVPTGIVSSEMVKNRVNHEITTESCRNCAKEGHDKDAIHCKFCGHILHDPVPLDTDS